MSNFISDLKLGKIYEAKYIQYRGFKNVYHPDIYLKEYDFENQDTGKKYEVKADRRANTTGNLFIEFECSGVKSGIDATTADYWIHYVTDTDNVIEPKGFVKIKCEKLREIIEDNNFTIRNGGDKYKVRGYLIPLNFVQKYFTQLSTHHFFLAMYTFYVS